MIQKFVERFEARRGEIRATLEAGHPSGYEGIVRVVVEALRGESDYDDTPDPERIHCINDGDYQGTLVFVIGAKGYQPSDYWAVKISYGSCSGCDTFEAIRHYSSDVPSEDQVNQYMTLATHVIQGLKEFA